MRDCIPNAIKIWRKPNSYFGFTFGKPDIGDTDAIRGRSGLLRWPLPKIRNFFRLDLPLSDDWSPVRYRLILVVFVHHWRAPAGNLAPISPNPLITPVAQRAHRCSTCLTIANFPQQV